MEKLIELLNEYEIEKEKSEWVNVDAYVEFKWEWVWEWYLNKWLTRFDETDHWEWDNLYWDTAVAYLISKSFWFIKWLVENDKIDFDKCWLDVRHYLSYNERYDKWIVMAENYDNDTLVREFYSPYKQLLMLLSIQDKPIDFLLSILK